MEARNAIITNTMLGYEDHGLFTFMLYLDYGGSGQGAGGYALDSWYEQKKKRVGWAYGIDVIARIMQVVGVEKWEDLKGKHIRARSDWGKVHAIGNFLKDDWMEFDHFFQSLSLNKE